MKWSRLLPAVLLAYILVVAVGIEAINAEWGYLLPRHADGEYGKMRGSMREFQDILALFGTWVYPACLYVSVGFICQVFGAKGAACKVWFLFCVALCLAVLARFCWLGVFSAGWAN